MKLQKRAEIQGEKKFLGVPVKDFEKAGREQLAYLLTAGLNPESKVVDVGCGVLRGGYWLIHFLNPGNYCGIEPHKERLETGIQNILEPEMLEVKRPRFDMNPFFDTSVFGEKFDFFWPTRCGHVRPGFRFSRHSIHSFAIRQRTVCS